MERRYNDAKGEAVEDFEWRQSYYQAREHPREPNNHYSHYNRPLNEDYSDSGPSRSHHQNYHHDQWRDPHRDYHDQWRDFHRDFRDHQQDYQEEAYHDRQPDYPQETSYDQQHEDAYAKEQQRQSKPTSQLRLVKLTSDVLPEDQMIAIIDGRSEGVSIGRDRSFTARIRCPSMEVSKHHANIFRMSKDEKGRKSRDAIFAVADTGSTHGTFLLLDPPPSLSSDSLPPVTAYQRLSPPKKASIPKGLRHMSLLRVGQTVFQAHLHSGWTSSCADCALSEDGSNEIPLVAKEKKDSKPSVSLTAQANQPSVNSKTVKVEPKQAIRELKSRHLGDEPSELSISDTVQYVDRAAARRARGGVQAAAPVSSMPAVSAPPRASAEAISEPAARLDSSNRGYQMFSSMTSKSGDSKLTHYDPIFARGVEGRAGLGSKRLLDVQEMASRPSDYSANSVRERQRRRFEETR